MQCHKLRYKKSVPNIFVVNNFQNISCKKVKIIVTILKTFFNIFNCPRVQFYAY